jgi:hypothetical protein
LHIVRKSSCFRKELTDAGFITVSLKPPLKWVIERERGDRKLGMAEQGFKRFYDGKHFDIVPLLHQSNQYKE